jgi:hypothetical protein
MNMVTPEIVSSEYFVIRKKAGGKFLDRSDDLGLVQDAFPFEDLGQAQSAVVGLADRTHAVAGVAGRREPFGEMEVCSVRRIFQIKPIA